MIPRHLPENGLFWCAGQVMLEDVSMNLADLNRVALAMVTPGKGILAADESSGTIKKRFVAINVESTEESRRDYLRCCSAPRRRLANISRASSSTTRPSGRK